LHGDNLGNRFSSFRDNHGQAGFRYLEVDGFVKTIFLSFLDALHSEEWLPEG